MNVVTVRDQHFDFKLKSDKVDSLTNFDFNTAEIDWMLNEAQSQLLKKKYGVHNSYRTGFEGNQKRIDDLKTLLVKFPEQPDIVPTLIEDGIYEINLSDLVHPYLFFIRAQAYIDGCNWISLRHIQHDDLNEILSDPFNGPDNNSLPFNFGRSSDSSGQSSIYIYPGIHNVDHVRFEYLKEPARIHFGGYTYIDGNTYPPQDSELPVHVRSEIVDEAVAIALGYVEDSNKYQIALNKAMMNE